MELKEILDLFKHFASARKRFEETARQLDAFDSGKIWETVRAKLPTHQLLPDTNYVNYIKSNLVNNIYSAGYIAHITPRTYLDQDFADKLNSFMKYVYEKCGLEHLQMLAGERAALTNVGGIYFSWRDDATNLTDDITGDVEATPVDPLSLYLDPAVTDYTKGQALFIAETVSRKVFEDTYGLSGTKKENGSVDYSSYGKAYLDSRTPTDDDDVVAVLTAFIRNNNGGIDSYIIADERVIVDQRDNIKPNRFPVCVLNGCIPTKDPYGVPVTKLCLRNILIVNLFDSIPVTHAYVSQRTAKLVRADLGVSLDTLARKLFNPDEIIEIQGDPMSAMKDVELAALPNEMAIYRQVLEESIYLVSGIDPTYTGRQTNSISTTGGMERLQQRAASTDNYRIRMLEKFAVEMSQLVFEMYVEFADAYQLEIGDEVDAYNEVVRIDFKKIREGKDKFQFSMNATPFLPRNAVRAAEEANIIMEKQAQYQMNPPLMSSEEWLACQNFGIKDIMLQRMKRERMNDALQNVTNHVTDFASLTQQGLDPQMAIQMLAEEDEYKRTQGKTGNTGNAGSFQNKQMG